MTKDRKWKKPQVDWRNRCGESLLCRRGVAERRARKHLFPMACWRGAAVFPWQVMDESLVREARLKPALTTETAYPMTTS